MRYLPSCLGKVESGKKSWSEINLENNQSGITNAFLLTVGLVNAGSTGNLGV